MKNKILVIGIVIVLSFMLVILTGCGNDNQNNTENALNKETQQSGNVKETNLRPKRDSDKRLYGYVDEDNDWVIEPKYKNAEEFSNGYARVMLDSHNYTFIDQKGTQITNEVFYSADDFATNGLAVVQKSEDGNYGYINNKGTLIINYKYSKAESFSKNGLALVKEDENSKYGYINERGEYILQAIYEEAQPFTDEGYAGVMLNSKVGVINKDGNLLFETSDYNYAWATENTDLVKVGQGVTYWKIKGTDRPVGGTFGILDLKGNIVSELKYLIIDEFFNGYAVVQDKNNKCGLIDNKGKEVIQCKYKSLKYNEEEGLYAATTETEKYYINEKDERIKDW